MTREWTLWGSHAAHCDGLPIKIMGGTLRECQAAANARHREGGWTLGCEPIGMYPEWMAKAKGE